MPSYRTSEGDNMNNSFEPVKVATVMNSTCIHLRVEGPNIYMYRRGRIYKEPLKKYNNRKG
jgi:hypothetical protein